MQNKIVDLRSIAHDIDFTFLAIAETKLNDSYPSAQFLIEGYCNPQEFRRDRTYNSGGGLLLYIRKGTPCKRLRKFEHDDIESIVVELHIGNKKWVCHFYIYIEMKMLVLKHFLTYFQKHLTKYLTYMNM